MREITAGPGLPFGKPSSPQTSMSGQIVGKRWIIGKHKLDNARAVTALKPLHELRQEFVSQLCAKYGIYAASRMLRHADRASAVWKERMPKTTADRVAVHRN